MILPLVILGAPSPSNGFLTVEMPDDLHNDQSWVGVLSQEVFECRYKWAHLWKCLSTEFRQDMEIRSHAVEWVVATTIDGKDPTAYRDYMILMLDRGYRPKGYFAGMSNADIAGKFAQYIAPAAEWVRKHVDFFRAHQR